MAATKVLTGGRWYVDPGTGDPPVYCSSSATADQVLAALRAGGDWELTFRVRFGGTTSPSEVTKVKKG